MPSQSRSGSCPRNDRLKSPFAVAIAVTRPRVAARFRKHRHDVMAKSDRPRFVGCGQGGMPNREREARQSEPEHGGRRIKHCVGLPKTTAREVRKLDGIFRCFAG